jgi:hypothetical protein
MGLATPPGGDRSLPTRRPRPLPPFFYDASRDGELSAKDAILVINFLNRRGTGEGEDAALPPQAHAAGTLSAPSWCLGQDALPRDAASTRSSTGTGSAQLAAGLPADTSAARNGPLDLLFEELDEADTLRGWERWLDQPWFRGRHRDLSLENLLERVVDEELVDAILQRL